MGYNLIIYLVVGFNPSEKYARQSGFIFPRDRDENKKCLKPPPSYNISYPIDIYKII